MPNQSNAPARLPRLAAVAVLTLAAITGLELAGLGSDSSAFAATPEPPVVNLSDAELARAQAASR